MKISSLCLAVLSFALIPAIDASALTIQYGTEKAQVGFMNQTSNPNQEELHPWGPRSFRVHNGEFWVADSVGGRVLHLAADGKLLHEVSVGTTSALIEDIALKTDAAGAVEGVFVVRSDTQEVVLLGLDGKRQMTFGSLGDEPGKFTQATFVECGKTGHVFVADVARETLDVFNPDGSFLRELHWEWSGFALDPAGNLARLKWDGEAKIGHLIIETPDGKQVNDIGLQIEDHTNPKLWWVGSKGESLVTYIPPAGFKGEYSWAICDTFGKPTSSGRVKPPVVMSRFLAQDLDATWYLVAADFNEAPKGNVKIETYEFK
ncbi:MAG TPA: hypothetical protein PKM25_11060 [Candidatus Ozemobacteraceae bacterium]|nr:hypothetical protein [Candidatus Ozemobacteraceae bacterium]